MNFIEDIEDATGLSEEALYGTHGIEITDEVNGESALILFGGLFATYDVPREVPEIVADIDYIINEGLLS